MSDIEFDYLNQAWIVDGRYVNCGHPENMNCGCFGRLHANQLAPVAPSLKDAIYRLAANGGRHA